MKHYKICDKCGEPIRIRKAVVGQWSKAVEQWRRQLMEAWAKDHRATMTALLEDGPEQEKDVLK